MLKQITVFLENKPGRMEEVTGCLAKENINIHALSIADTTDFGILRMIVSDPEKAAKLLKGKHFMVKIADAIAVAMGHSPGSLHKVLQKLRELDISIEYMYAFTSRHKDHEAIVILSVSNQTAAIDMLRESGFPVLDESLLTQLNQS
ncbi:MAG: ACT domain-containing protein [Oscillospiraceae bacterium]|nr:ACT domain-containing protein [Oscillospiraceae bacterium]